MSDLAYTATYVRLGRSPFGAKHKEARAFAQCLAGGSGLLVVTPLLDDRPPIRILDTGLPTSTLLMAGLALADPDVPLTDEADSVATRLRKLATQRDLELDPADADALANAVRDLSIELRCTVFHGEPEPAAEGEWGGWGVVGLPTVDLQ